MLRKRIEREEGKPTSLANPELRRLIHAPGNILDVAKSLHHIIKETSGGIRSRLALPIRKAIAEQDIRAARDQRISSAVLVLIPRIRRSDLEARQGGLDVHDLGEQLRACEVAAV
jgi:hypothetical protein